MTAISGQLPPLALAPATRSTLLQTIVDTLPLAAARRKVLTQMQEGDARRTRRWFGVAHRPCTTREHLRVLRASLTLSALDSFLSCNAATLATRAETVRYGGVSEPRLERVQPVKITVQRY